MQRANVINVVENSKMHNTGPSIESTVGISSQPCSRKMKRYILLGVFQPLQKITYR
jgi:hypothetical protein